jgi:hypothetical protein
VRKLRPCGTSTEPPWHRSSAWYVERVRAMAAAGDDLAGEARLIDANVPRGAPHPGRRLRTRPGRRRPGRHRPRGGVSSPRSRPGTMCASASGVCRRSCAGTRWCLALRPSGLSIHLRAGGWFRRGKRGPAEGGSYGSAVGDGTVRSRRLTTRLIVATAAPAGCPSPSS